MHEQPTIALVDDHVMLRRGLADTLENLGFKVVYQASSGLALRKEIGLQELPDIILMDIQMPGMNGFDATAWLRDNYPTIQVLALSMHDDEFSVIKMLRNGAKGYILKDNEPEVLKAALESVFKHGFYYSDLVTGKIVRSLTNKDAPHALSARQIKFLGLVCTEFTYKEIAQKMNLSPRTIDGYRDELFEKLEVKSRVGLVLYAMKHRIVSLDGSPINTR